MKRKLGDLSILHPFGMGVKWTRVQKVIQKMIKDILYEKLTKKQVKMFEVKNYHSWDPNYPEKGLNQGLLEHLIFEAVNSISSFNGISFFYSKLYLYDLKKFTGISDIKIFENEILEINKRWTGLASIELKSTTNFLKPEIFVSIFRKPSSQQKALCEKIRILCFHTRQYLLRDTFIFS